MDGITWTILGSLNFEVNPTDVKEIKKAQVNFPETTARYIKVSAASRKILPIWHAFKGEPCWIFADELVVE
jgi:hexosaminidase